MKNFLLVCLFLAVAFASQFRNLEREHKTAFLSWMKQHKRSYPADEFQKRFGIFRENYEFVKNWDGDFKVALNEFADLAGTEFKTMYHNLNILVDPATMVNDAQVEVSTSPASIDWRTQGAVTPIKNQGQCGSCWSFSTTGSFEGCHKLATGTLVSFSEQNLVDCSTAEGNQGCNGGLMDDAFQYIIKNKGLDTEASYPYTATGPNACKYKAANSGGYLTGYKDIPSGSESALIAAAGSVGPISVAIDASQNSFQFYSSGIYYAKGCSPTQLDHGVLVVGYGSTSAGSNNQYYIVKNSWGTSWGINGYIWMSRNRNNNCGIATAASYPTGCTST